MERVEPAKIDPSKVFEKPKKPLAGLDKSKSLRPKRKIKEGNRGKPHAQFAKTLHSRIQTVV